MWFLFYFSIFPQLIYHEKIFSSPHLKKEKEKENQSLVEETDMHSEPALVVDHGEFHQRGTSSWDSKLWL